MECTLNISVKSRFLMAGGVIAAATAVWHLLCIIGGPSWYVFARAPQVIVDSAKQGTFLAPLGATVIASLMFACSVYSLSGAGLIRKIPLLMIALVSISLICLIRGLVTVPYLLSSKLDTWELIASSGWFFVGVCFLMGALEQFSAKKTNI
jgi:hypothetical protein